MRKLAALSASTLLAAFVACSSDPPASGGGGTPDGGGSSSSSASSSSSSGGSSSGGADGGSSSGDGGSGCTGACKTTSLTITVDGKSAPLDRAQFGFNATDAGAAPSAQVEAHFGGDPACPTQTSPTPDRTIVFAKMPLTKTVATEADGVKATLLDFKGTLTSQPALKASAVKITVVDVQTTPAGTAYIAFDVDAAFPGGTLKGHAYAAHCDSMDE